MTANYERAFAEHEERCFFSKTLDGVGALPDASYAELDPELLDALVVGKPIAAA